MTHRSYKKNAAYRKRCVASGRCPHCGKPCAPYFHCSERRFYQKVYRTLLTMERYGALARTSDGWVLGPQPGARWRDTSVRDVATDRRCGPRIAGRPFDLEGWLVDTLQAAGADGVAEADLERGYTATVLAERLWTLGFG